MALPEHEQQILDDIECALWQEDRTWMESMSVRQDRLSKLSQAGVTIGLIVLYAAIFAIFSAALRFVQPPGRFNYGLSPWPHYVFWVWVAAGATTGWLARWLNRRFTGSRRTGWRSWGAVGGTCAFGCVLLGIVQLVTLIGAGLNNRLPQLLLQPLVPYFELAGLIAVGSMVPVTVAFLDGVLPDRL